MLLSELSPSEREDGFKTHFSFRLWKEKRFLHFKEKDARHIFTSLRHADRARSLARARFIAPLVDKPTV